MQLSSNCLLMGILKTKTFAKVRKSSVKRYRVRRVWISVTEKLLNIYLDEDSNVRFDGHFLEELNPEELENQQGHREDHHSKIHRYLEQHSAIYNRPYGFRRTVCSVVILGIAHARTDLHWIFMCSGL